MESSDPEHSILLERPKEEIDRIQDWIRETVLNRMRKKGVVIGLSGGVDSSVCAALCVNSLGKERVLGLFMPEKDCKSETNDLGRLIASHLDITTITEDITPVLTSAGCYERRDDGIRMTIPEYGPDWMSKVVLPSILDSNRLSISNIVVRDPNGSDITKRMRTRSYLQVVAASNFKQRTRKMMEYYHGDRLNYAVVGTPNKLEYDLGFFVKNGDGAADIKPIGHLYKTQVYQIGELLGIPEKILSRPPTTDTYSLPQSQEEFYFSLPYDKMDIALHAYDNNYSEKKLGEILDVDEDTAGRIYLDIRNKKRMASFLHLPPQVPE